MRFALLKAILKRYRNKMHLYQHMWKKQAKKKVLIRLRDISTKCNLNNCLIVEQYVK